MYIKVNDGFNIVDFDPEHIRAEHRNVSFPSVLTDELLADYNVFPIIETAQPNYEPLTHKLQMGALLVDNVWTQTWTAIELSDDEKAQELANLIDLYEQAVQNHLDAKVGEKGYDSIVSATSYAGAPNPFQQEGIKALNWRGAVWAKCYQILNDFKDGNREKPTIEQLINELPELVW